MISLSIPVDKIPFIRSIEGRKFRDGKWLFPESSYETLVKYGLLDKEYKVEKRSMFNMNCRTSYISIKKKQSTKH